MSLTSYRTVAKSVKELNTSPEIAKRKVAGNIVGLMIMISFRKFPDSNKNKILRILFQTRMQLYRKKIQECIDHQRMGEIIHNVHI